MTLLFTGSCLNVYGGVTTIADVHETVKDRYHDDTGHHLWLVTLVLHSRASLRFQMQLFPRKLFRMQVISNCLALKHSRCPEGSAFRQLVAPPSLRASMLLYLLKATLHPSLSLIHI